MKPSEILTATKALLEEKGWVGHAPRTYEEGNCAVTAVDVCSRTPFESFSAREVLRLYVVGKNGSLADWNDSSTEAEVLAAFDEAIKLAKEQENAGR